MVSWNVLVVDLPHFLAKENDLDDLPGRHQNYEKEKALVVFHLRHAIVNGIDPAVGTPRPKHVPIQRVVAVDRMLAVLAADNPLAENPFVAAGILSACNLPVVPDSHHEMETWDGLVADSRHEMETLGDSVDCIRHHGTGRGEGPDTWADRIGNRRGNPEENHPMVLGTGGWTLCVCHHETLCVCHRAIPCNHRPCACRHAIPRNHQPYVSLRAKPCIRRRYCLHHHHHPPHAYHHAKRWCHGVFLARRRIEEKMSGSRHLRVHLHPNGSETWSHLMAMVTMAVVESHPQTKKWQTLLDWNDVRHVVGIAVAGEAVADAHLRILASTVPVEQVVVPFPLHLVVCLLRESAWWRNRQCSFGVVPCGLPQRWSASIRYPRHDSATFHPDCA
mmetsp:Transcript_22464/g.51771  ORF Transcript_22464/g.51771 Transcript_22464/m.51771 type:complete len:389 (-) Transcript_22464:258-1424(-)